MTTSTALGRPAETKYHRWYVHVWLKPNHTGVVWVCCTYSPGHDQQAARTWCLNYHAWREGRPSAFACGGASWRVRWGPNGRWHVWPLRTHTIPEALTRALAWCDEVLDAERRTQEATAEAEELVLQLVESP